MYFLPQKKNLETFQNFKIAFKIQRSKKVKPVVTLFEKLRHTKISS